MKPYLLLLLLAVGCNKKGVLETSGNKQSETSTKQTVRTYTKYNDWVIHAVIKKELT